jgi:iron complex outermembrane receptor protein
MAAAGNGAFVDISLIPLSAVERIDVLMDGASAIYGSDAVGGVVNISLKKHYSGAETGLRYGTVTEGNHHELQASQTIGVASDSGEVLVSYEYFRRSSLAGSDRTFVQPQPGLLDEIVLVPEQKRHSVLTVFSKKLNDSVELYGDAFYAERESQLNYQESGVPQIQMNDVGHYGASVGASIDLFRDWSAHASLSVNEIESKSRTVGMPGAVLQYKTNNESRLITAEFTAEGTVLEIPAGDVQLAIGAQFRDDRFVEGNDLYPARLARDVSAVYAELLLPVVGEAGMQGGNRLEMSLAGRFEQYSDFGSTFNPKLGVSWRPMDGLNVRGSWGTSFKAPLLSQMNRGDLWVGVEVDRYRDSAGPVTAITLTGAGERLGAEESENLTVGFDLSSPSHPHMTLSATYFDTEYEDRIRTPLPSGYDAHGSILQDQAYADLITRNPSGDRVSELMSHPKAYCYTQTALCAAWPQAEDVIAIVDRRLRNIAGLRTKGMDITATYQWKTDWGNWQAQVGGTNYFEYRERHAPGAAEVDAMNDVWRPVDLRMRAGLSFSRGAFDAASFVNYADSYRDTRGANWTGATPKRSSVSSWTTVDLTLRYVLGNLFASGGNGKSTLALSATNIFDKDPPYVASYAGLFFDGVNASPLGRFISVQLNVQL